MALTQPKTPISTRKKDGSHTWLFIRAFLRRMRRLNKQHPANAPSKPSETGSGTAVELSEKATLSMRNWSLLPTPVASRPVHFKIQLRLIRQRDPGDCDGAVV